jgi:ubiquitin carboxyl-terminal hydrolase 25
LAAKDRVKSLEAELKSLTEQLDTAFI